MSKYPNPHERLFPLTPNIFALLLPYGDHGGLCDATLRIAKKELTAAQKEGASKCYILTREEYKNGQGEAQLIGIHTQSRKERGVTAFRKGFQEYAMLIGPAIGAITEELKLRRKEGRQIL